MTAHEHRFAIISHTEDRWKVLVSCQIMPCNKIEVWNQPKMKIKIEARKFRPARRPASSTNSIVPSLHEKAASALD